MSKLDSDPWEVNCDEPYNNEAFDADEEYPRNEEPDLADHPGPFASINQIVSYYERQGIFAGEDDALGS